MTKNFWVVLVGLLPHCALKLICLRRLGFAVSRTARIGPILVWRVGHLSVGERSVIGPFNVLRNLEQFELADCAVIGQWNWFSAAPTLTHQNGDGGMVKVGPHAALTSRHYIDASGGFSLGAFSTLAGVRSTVITHGIDWVRSEQRASPVTIGQYCLVGSNVQLAPGASVPDRSVVGMGSVIGRGDIEAGLIVANRASFVRAVSGEYFNRRSGFVS